MATRRRAITRKTKKTADAPPPAPEARSPLAGIFDAAYQAGTAVADTARWLIVGTVRAAESLVADADRWRSAASSNDDGLRARKPLARARSRAGTARRRRRAS